jgi:hypothetical protein
VFTELTTVDNDPLLVPYFIYPVAEISVANQICIDVPLKIALETLLK